MPRGCGYRRVRIVTELLVSCSSRHFYRQYARCRRRTISAFAFTLADERKMLFGYVPEIHTLSSFSSFDSISTSL